MVSFSNTDGARYDSVNGQSTLQSSSNGRKNSR